MTRERYHPVPLDTGATLKRWSRDPAFVAAYDALEDEFAALTELVRARQQADMTQAEVARRMGIAQASVARMESSAGSRKHAPSIATLRRYADAVGCELRITLTPARKIKGKTSHARGVYK
jgi:DNA-binding XRE family transcriptional regulator